MILLYIAAYVLVGMVIQVMTEEDDDSVGMRLSLWFAWPLTVIAWLGLEAWTMTIVLFDALAAMVGWEEWE